MENTDPNQDDLLESVKLVEDTKKAQASTPGLFTSFTNNTQKKAILERKEDKEESNDDPYSSSEMTDTQGTTVDVSETNDDPDTDAQETQSVDITDHIDDPDEESDKATETTEALDDWIREKTQGSDSGFVRGAGSVMAGLSHLGIKYGPSLLNAMYRGTLWTFSRIGSLTFKSIEGVSALIEKSKNSITVLDKRLLIAEKNLVSILNANDNIPTFKYKNTKVLSFVKVGNNLDIARNISSFSQTLQNVTAAMVDEFETGLNVVKRISDSGLSAQDVDIVKIMKVKPPSQGFGKGNPTGVPLKSDLSSMYHTTDIWPGDTELILILPNDNADIEQLMKGYEESKAYLLPNKGAKISVGEINSLTGPQLLMVVKSCKQLLAACRKVIGYEERVVKLSPGFLDHAKNLFYKAADDKEKSKAAQSLARPLYLKTQLCIDVYDKAASKSLIHASRVLAAGIQLIEDHVKQLSKLNK